MLFRVSEQPVLWIQQVTLRDWEIINSLAVVLKCCPGEDLGTQQVARTVVVRCALWMDGCSSRIKKEDLSPMQVTRVSGDGSDDWRWSPMDLP